MTNSERVLDHSDLEQKQYLIIVPGTTKTDLSIRVDVRDNAIYIKTTPTITFPEADLPDELSCDLRFYPDKRYRVADLSYILADGLLRITIPVDADRIKEITAAK